MGMMKRYLMEKVTEYADIIGFSEEAIYADPKLYALACKYADIGLKAMGRDLEAARLKDAEEARQKMDSKITAMTEGAKEKARQLEELGEQSANGFEVDGSGT